MFTASQLISALIQKMGAKSVTLTYAEVMSFGTKHPTQVEVSEDGATIALTISPETFVENERL